MTTGSAGSDIQEIRRLFRLNEQGAVPDGERLARSALDASRAGIHLGWKPFTDLESGTASVIEWFRQRDS